MAGNLDRNKFEESNQKVDTSSTNEYHIQRNWNTLRNIFDLVI